jgi:hypothetical protein
MSLTSCIKELGSALSSIDKNKVVDATLRLRRTVKDANAAALQASEAHAADLRQQLVRSEEIDRAHPAGEGEAFESVGMTRTAGKEAWTLPGLRDYGGHLKNMSHYVAASFKDGEYTVWQSPALGQQGLRADERTFTDLGKAEAYAKQLASQMRPVPESAPTKPGEPTDDQKIREQMVELGLEYGIPRMSIVNAEDSPHSFELRAADNHGVSIHMHALTDHVTKGPVIHLDRYGKGIYESVDMPTKEAAGAVLQRWLDDAAGKTPKTTFAEDKAARLAQFPVGTHVKIASWNRTGQDNGKFAGRTGEVVDGHFDGWYVKLDPTLRERAVKKILVLTNDRLEQVDKASIKPPRSQAEIQAERRETERTIFNDLIKHHVGGPLATMEVLEAEIRRRAGDVELTDDQVKKLAEGIRKKAAAGIQEAAKAAHRNPAVLQAAIGQHVANTYRDASAVTPEQHSAFMGGFQHAMAGKTKSTLTGEPLADKLKGYAAAMKWRTTEEGAAWFEGRSVNKLQNTGLDLRRHWEALREQMKASESDVKKAWRQIERATTRADLFVPYTTKEAATPGYRAYAEAVRDGTTPFKAWLLDKYTDWSGERSWSRRNKKDGDPTDMDLILDGERYPSFIVRTVEDGRNHAHIDDAARVKFQDDPAFRAQWLRAAANAYVDQVRDFTSFLHETTTAKDAAAGFDERFGNPARDKTDTQPYSTYKHLNDAGRALTSNEKTSMWSGKASSLMQLLSNASGTAHLIKNETTYEAPDKSKPLVPPRLDRVERSGMPDQRKGENVTPLHFKDTLGFADVGFGKWVGAQQDQDHLNYSFDAFVDLANFLKMEPKNIGFGGKLHFTIGALGHGKFAAHFQRAHPSPEGGTVAVINVTNTRGDGTLGHEWIHSLDAAMGGDWKGSVRRILLSALRFDPLTPKTVEDEAAKFLIGGWFWNGNKKLSKEQAAVRGMQYLSPSKAGSTAYHRNAIQMGKDYWGNDEEMIARAAEAWMLDNLGGSNTYLVNPLWAGDGVVTKEKGYRGTPYPSGDERKRFAKVFDALARSIKWADGRPTVAYDDFRKNLGEQHFDWEKRRDSLNSLEAMTKFRAELLEQRQQAAADAAAKVQLAAEAVASELEKETAPEEPIDEPIVDAPGPDQVSGPLDDNDLEDLFDQAAAELREERQEQPGVEPPPDAASEPDPEPQPETRASPAQAAANEREVAKRIGDLVQQGVPVVFSGTEWATSHGLPTIHDFPSDKVRHVGFGVFEIKSDAFDGSWLAGGAMDHGAPGGTSYTTVSVERGEWSDYPKQKVLDALEAFINAKPQRAPAGDAPHDKSASQLLAAAAKQGVKGADEALKGLAKIFDALAGKGGFHSWPGDFNEDAYQQAKPHFQAALEAFQEAGRTLKDLFKMLIAQYGDGVKEYAIRFAKDQKLTANLGTTAPADPESPNLKIAFVVRQQLAAGVSMDWRQLFELADQYFGGTQAEGKYTPKDAYDAMEMGVNLHLQSGNGEAFSPEVDQSGAAARVQVLERLMQLLPTQTKRTSEQMDMQQFSTVPPLAYLASWVANPNDTDTVLEPSAGLGGLAVFAKNAGARVVLNELSSRRAALLQEIFPASKVWTENAEQLNNILPDEIQPSVVLMNPPFSNSVSTNIKRDTMIGARHVEQALERLAPGGRLVAIVGEGMARDKPAFRDWWKGIDEKYTVKAAIPIDGSGYAKYGTSFDNVLLVIDKVKVAWPFPVKTTKVQKYGELIPLLTEIRDARPVARAQGNERDSLERDAAERAREESVRRGERDAGPGAAADGPAVVGDREAPGTGGGRGNRSGGSSTRNGEPGGSVRAPGGEGVAAGNDAGERSAPAGTPAPAVTSSVGDQQHTEAITASVFEPYRPQRLQVEGAKEHPGKLVQSAAMATVLPPATDYVPNLPHKTITDGQLSIAQLEAVVYAGQAHRELLNTGERKGYFIGDGTGVGKGREISGILLDNWRQGRKKHVWVSEKQGLMTDAKRDFSGVSGDADLIFNQNETDAEGKIAGKQGILFTTYATLRSGANSQALNPKPLTDQALAKSFAPGASVMIRRSSGSEPESFPLHADGFKLREDKIYIDYNGRRNYVQSKHVVSIDGVADWKMGKPKKKAGQSRLEQLVNWLGKDFDGVLVFDEAHNAGNAVAMKGDRGFTDPSLQALSVVELQKQLPKARVVYVSATGATEVSNLSYATRLGLWGEGTPFADVHGFIDQMTAGGLATMELVARDMKQLGVYLARSLSFEGVTYSRVEHELTPVQRGIYNRLAQAWQVVLQNFEAALEATKADGSPQAKSAARSAFWSGQQRFFNQVITSMQMPSVLADVEQELGRGNAVVLQLVNTNEAAQERSLAKRKEGEEAAELEELDLTPRDQLLNMVAKSFPVNQYEEYRDDNGKKQVRQVLDSKGNPVQNKEQVAVRDKLLKDLELIQVPEGPLEQIINNFGPDQVAEITGRSRRVVDGRWNKKAKGERFIETRGGAAIRADASAFMGDKKPILIFSDAGGTGFSFHSDRGAKNQRQRIHYLVQPGWRANKAVQGFGRTHRTNEANEPHYKLVATDIPAHKRFLSAIARRLDQLGALTKGQRDTANQGLFSEKDNLEGVYAQQAVREFIDDVMAGRGGGDLNGRDLLRQMGLEGIINPDTGQVNDSKYPETRMFLNRMLSLELETQGAVFDHFIRVMEQKVDVAIQRGEFDAGLQTIQALSAHMMRDEVVYTEPKSGAETRYVELELTQPTRIYSMPTSTKFRTISYLRNKASGRVWAKVGEYDRTAKDGSISKHADLSGTGGYQNKPLGELGGQNWEKLTVDEARTLWEAENEKRPKTYTERAHMIVGALLPIWDRLEGTTRIKVVRTQTDDGRRYLGRQIDASDLKAVLKRLDVKSAAATMSPGQIMAAVLRGQEAELANGWKLKRSVVSGDPRIELVAGYVAGAAMRELTENGVIHEQIQWKDRLFIPTSKEGSTVLAKLIKNRPVVELSGEAKGGEDVAFARRQSRGGGHGFDDARRTMIQQAVDQVTATWKRKPQIHVIATMADAPAGAQAEMAAQDAQNAAGDTAGFLYEDAVYLVADQLGDRDEIRTVLYHEALGHWGLRAVWGDGLVPILRQLATMRPQLIAKKAKEYGLDLTKEEDRLLAAEEVLAEMAQTRPDLGWVQRAISLIRKALRAIGLVQGLTDSDIVASYILPARGFVERGQQAAANPDKTVRFSRGFNTREIQVDGKWRPIVDAKGRLLAQGDFGKQQSFWRWFGDSKVVDEAGRPQPVYHATDADFTEFQRSEDIGFHFGPTHAANVRARQAQLEDASIMPAYLRIEKPLRMPDLHTWAPRDVAANLVSLDVITQEQADQAGEIGREQVRDWLAAKGYDGIVYENETEGGDDSYIVFDSQSVKSTTGNDGSYNPKNPDVRFSRLPGYRFDAKSSPLFKQRSAADAHAVSQAAADAALQKDATARRILDKGVKVADGELVGVRLNINVLKSTGVAVQSLHRGNKGDGYTQNRGLFGGEVIGYQPVVTLKDAYFNVGQKARERIATGEGPKEPMASVDGRYVADAAHAFDGVEFRFNPKREHLFRDGLGRVLRHADEVTITGHSVFARGNVEYYGPDDVPARAGDAPTQGKLLQPGDNSGRPVFSRKVTPLQKRNAEQRLAALGYSVERGYEDEPGWIEHQDGTQYDWNAEANRFEDEEGNPLPQEAAEIAQYIGNVVDGLEDPDAAGGAANDRSANPFRPVFARTTTIGATRTYTPEQEQAMKNVGFTVEQPTLRERTEALWKDAGKRLAQGIADQFRPVKDLSSEAYALLRLSRGASGAFETMLHGGRLKLTDGVYDFDDKAKGGVLKKLLIPLQGEHHDFFRWIAANRAERLKGEGRERLFTDQDIAAFKTLADGQLQSDYTLQNGPRAGQTTRSRAEAYSDSLATFNEFNKNVLDMAEQSGLIDGENRKLWEHEFYVPFYRVSEDFDGGFRGANIKTGAVRQKAFEKLKGGKEKLNADLLDNTLLNWAHLLDAAAKNRAAKATLEAAQAAGIAIEAREEVARQIGRATGNRQGVVWFADQGLQRYFVVDDPYILDALTSLEYAGMRSPVMAAMGAFKHALTIGVTASPFFKVRNLMRDSITAIGSAPLSANVAKNLVQGWKDTNPESDRYFQLLAGGGTIHFGTMLEGSEAKRVQALVESGVDQATILNSADKVQAFYRHWIEPAITAYNELGNRGEAVNRAALYDQLRKQGKSHAEASLQARDLMDFSMQGTWTSIRFLTQVVPFFNARVQGLYKLGRAAKEDPARFGMVVGTAALVSLALLAAYGGDDDWKRREEWDRDNFWWFKFGGVAFRIPKPFEIGAMATLAERGAELLMDDEMTGSRFRKSVLKIASDQLSMNPIPQLIKPMVDVYANWDSFTDRPIETMDMQRLLPDYRFADRTSMTARGTSTALNAVAGTIGGKSLSPVQVDHLLQGYFGWLGSFIVSAGDTVFRPATGQPRQAAPDYWKSLSGGMVAELEGAPSRYVSQMYEQAGAIEEAYGTWRMLMRQGKGEEAAQFRQENQALLAKYTSVERIKRQEGELNSRIREVERSDMEPVAKRERIQQIRDQQDRLSRSLSPGASR